MKKIILNFEEKESNFKELVQTALNLNLLEVLISSKTATEFKNIERIRKYSFSTEIEADNLIFFDIDKIPKNITKETNVGIYKELRTKQDERDIIEYSRQASINFVIVKAKDWKIIPFENLIAEIHKTNTDLIAAVDDIGEAELMLKTLQIGTDGILMTPKNSDDIKQLKQLSTELYFKLKAAKITNIQSVSESERVCVDTTSLLKEGEGMLIGSTAKGFVLIQAEVFDTNFVASRPFRVNAGDVSAYVLVPSNNTNLPYKTKYLSELKGGDKVIIADYYGNARIVNVGRVKIETRPMLRLELEFRRENEIIKINYIGQNAETIRLIKPGGQIISIVDIKVGEEVLIHLGPGATHFGTAVDEDIIEK
ncbi:MAG: 3-dehydroquinate synthase II [Candidatus Hermodarchaeota archaeon]